MRDAEMASEAPPFVSDENFSTSRCNEEVAEFNALIDGLELPGHLMNENAEKTDQDFDVNLYFTVLDRLSMEPGYVLDYVYFYIDDFAGGPYLYARRADEPPYKNYYDFSDAGSGANLSEREDYYLSHIVADGSPESFFQLSLLRIQGDQFYLFWHAKYNDARIVCDHDYANDTLADLGSRYLSTEEILPKVKPHGLFQVFEGLLGCLSEDCDLQLGTSRDG